MTAETAAGTATGTSAPDGPLPPVRFWPALDHFGVDFDPVMVELMREGPVTRIRLPHGEGWAWLVTRHEDVRMVTNDPRFSRKAVVGRDITRLAPHFIPLKDSVAFQDPPDHTRIRRAVAPAFTARGVERLRDRARETLDGLVADVLRDGPPADFTERLLAPFPLAVICELMGVPAADRDDVHRWTALILASEDGEGSERAKQEMHGYFTGLMRERSAGDGEDVTGLLGGAVAAGEVPEAAAAGFAVLLQIGGEAVTKNCGNMLYILLTHPGHLARLRSEPALRPSAIDELLRYIPHRNAVGLSRIALEDVTVGGVRIRAGEPVHVSYVAANRDPDVFPEPGRIDLTRRPNPHVAFGHGPHYCVGALLARMETELLVSAFLDRFPRLRFAVPVTELRWQRGALIRGPEALPVTW
ncbi:cytochrome P450 [Streptomyces sp. WAC 00631]|uniref:cytochrome P450 n=1 Tax=Streptomyces sp. WAC 00631 TaxID=2203201 RepID=UPI001E5F5FBC|nr:cytochrome P450 [Streptomyces sp. WAC 00631]MCC5033555.1 cytochrome P450 [Streptomyces sp. WAC 00631]